MKARFTNALFETERLSRRVVVEQAIVAALALQEELRSGDRDHEHGDVVTSSGGRGSVTHLGV
jgi:hypothetical protein